MARAARNSAVSAGDTVIRKLKAITIDFQHKLANGFGFIKNAMLLTEGKPPEPMDGHINWALGHSDSVVQSEIKSEADKAIRYISGNM